MHAAKMKYKSSKPPGPAHVNGIIEIEAPYLFNFDGDFDFG